MQKAKKKKMNKEKEVENAVEVKYFLNLKTHAVLKITHPV